MAVARIEILPVSLIDEYHPLVEALKRRARSLRIELGWHYLLDLTWMLTNLGPVDGRHIMDAGAGMGLLRWVLAEQGAEVVSVDRYSRAALPPHFRARYEVRGLRREDLAPIWRFACPPSRSWRALLRRGGDWLRFLLPRQAIGRVIIYNQDLKSLTDIPDHSLDAVAAVSALEHNSPEGLGQVVMELRRVLKPGGVLLATLGAARDKDWFHAPSKGWCYTDKIIRRLFDLSRSTPSNYDHFDELFAARKGGRILTVGNTGGQRFEIDNRYVFTKHLSILGSTMSTLRGFAQAMDLVTAGKLRVALDRTFPLAEARLTQERMERNKHFGKITLNIN